MPPDDITLGEIWRIMADRDARTERRFDQLGAQVAGLAFVNRETYNAERADDRRRIAQLEGQQRWFYRLLATTALGSVATAILGLLSAKGSL